MKKFAALTISLFALVALGLLIARVTEAEAPGPNLAAPSAPAPLGGTPTPTECALTYTYTVSAGTPVPANNPVPGTQCFGCTAPITLPFPFTFYGQTYTSANVSPEGNLQFTTASTSLESCPFPYPQLGPSIMPYWCDCIDTTWTDFCVDYYYGLPCGVYTSTSGTAPNRIYNIQWFGRQQGSNHEPFNFEIRLYETSNLIDFAYGTGVMFGYGTTIGVQDGSSQYTSYLCNTSTNLQNTVIQWSPSYPPSCPTYTPIFTPTASPTECTTGYSYEISSGAIVSGTTLLAGSQCGHCLAPVNLPFSFTYYGQTYSTANVSSYGQLQFTTTDTSTSSCPFPYPQLGPAILPDWDDALDMGQTIICQNLVGRPCGIYTSVSGTAPNRIFNIEWLARRAGSSTYIDNFELHLYETTNVFDFVYGILRPPPSGHFSVVGIQDGSSSYISFACYTDNGIYQDLLVRWTPASCSTTPTPVSTSTSTSTSTPLPSTATTTPTSTPTSSSTTTVAVPTGTPTGTPLALTATGTPADTTTSTPVLSTETATSTPSVPPTSTNTPEATPTPILPTVTGTPTTCTIQFTDMPEGSTFYSYIQCLACRGIINGYSDGTFKPENNVTRGQLAKIVSNSADFSDTPGPQQFEDVPPGSTFYDFVWRLAVRNIVSGYPCGGPGEPCGLGGLPYFRPNANITRGQISKIVSEAAGFHDTPGAQQFEDVLPGSTFYGYIWRLADRDIMNGYPCGGPGEPCGSGNLPYFRPGANATRGQASKIVANTFFPGCSTR